MKKSIMYKGFEIRILPDTSCAGFLEYEVYDRNTTADISDNCLYCGGDGYETEKQVLIDAKESIRFELKERKKVWVESLNLEAGTIYFFSDFRCAWMEKAKSGYCKPVTDKEILIGLAERSNENKTDFIYI